MVPDLDVEALLRMAICADDRERTEFTRLLGVLDAPERARLQARLRETSPGHPWLLDVWAASST